MKKTLCVLCALLALTAVGCVKEAPEPIYVPPQVRPEDRVPTHTEESEGVIYQYYNDKTCEVVGLLADEIVGKELEIPEEHERYRVVGVGDGAFRDSTLTQVVLPDTVTHIGGEAFRGAAIKEMKLPASLETMGDECFDNCLNLAKVTFPATLKQIPLAAFYGCRSLEEVILPDGVESIGEEAFASLSALKKVRLPASLKEIGPYAFWQSGTEELFVTVPEGVQEIGEEAFAGVKTSLGEGA